jgi:hypothetical protein
MEALPGWLAEKVHAAGVCGVYNADEWDRLLDPKYPRDEDPPVFAEWPPMPH